ncbi:MAG: HNH endonuclease [Symploca sp. SIO2E9]|nr:HNH endonuclease [Symploca sp. SIO2E9]
MRVFVVNQDKKPLNTCHPAKARKLLSLGRAAVWRHYPFTIILKGKERPIVTTEHRIKIDPGSKTTGLAILNGNRVVFAANLIHHGDTIRKTISERRAVRRNRRHRQTRYRKCRFNRSQPKGWLAPSLMSRVNNILSWVKRLVAICPIRAISQELVRFDTQKLQNPEISGVEYQQGELWGYEVKEYLLEKWGRQCVYCGATDTQLEVEHIHPRSKGGSNRLSNLTIACRDCNLNKSNSKIKNFLSGKPDLLQRILKIAKVPLKDAAAVNATRWELYRQLQSLELPVEVGTGGRTKYNRTRLGLPKTHYWDAASVGESTPKNLRAAKVKPLTIKAMGRGNRQICTTNKHGFPIRHRTRCKTFYGFRTGDMVRAILPQGKFAGTHIGRLTVRKSGVFEMNTPKGKITPVRHKYCQLIQRNDGYMYSFVVDVQ